MATRMNYMTSSQKFAGRVHVVCLTWYTLGTYLR